ncbi:hypothetical protein [Streptomyces sp. NBC_00094]|uniref:hypothetical protein n=1 Tax=Streptomyces sp. NBC_00094 TaxID=2903620 RepID=UPI00224CA343|nr:hypothetical protein [Streptomyces sp. NBC_00094]MCX5392545.1 hypothetical protein [Streptomyces sp. NBC_00094]
MPVRSGWLLPTGQTRQNTRITSIGATTPVNPFASRSGILPGTYDGKYRVGGLWMSGNGPMTATVYHGRAVVQGGTTDGSYPVALDEDITITFGDGDPLNPRIDLVVLRVYDNDIDALGKYEAAIEIVRGEPAAVPVAPTPPPVSLTLFSVRVKAGASAGTGGVGWADGILTDLRTTIASVGGILPVYNNAAVPGAYPGQYQDNDNSHFLQRWDGTSWVAYPREIGGIAPNNMLSTGSYIGQFRETNGVLQRWNGTTWANYQPPVEVETASGALNTYGGWTVSNFTARRTRGVATVRVSMTRAGTDITAGSTGTIPDQQMCVLPTGWRPVSNYEAPASDYLATGGATIFSTGIVSLRSWTPTAVIPNGRIVHITATYVL